MLLDEAPDLLGDLFVLMADHPVVDHPAQLMRRPFQERLLLLRQRDRRDGAQLLPIWLAREQLRIEADGSGVQGFLLRGRHPGEDALDLVEERRDQRDAPQGRDGETSENDDRQPGENTQQVERRLVPIAVD